MVEHAPTDAARFLIPNPLHILAIPVTAKTIPAPRINRSRSKLFVRSPTTNAPNAVASGMVSIR